MLLDRKMVILAILDGWGTAPPGPGNAITQARTPNINRLWSSYPHTLLRAAGDAVGLPRDEAGNTETGHLNIGAGRIVYQDLERINMSVADGTIFENKALIGAIEHASKNNSNLHVMGLVGAGGVHSNIEHLFAIIRLVKQKNFSRLFLHIITDGRDSPPTTSHTYILKIEEMIKKEGVGQVASLMGRYWAMDRDRRWDRTEKAYLLLTEGKGKIESNTMDAIKKSYSEGITDEFIEPVLFKSNDDTPLPLISDNDAVIFYNFRIDRPRQLTAAFVIPDFTNNSISLDFDPYLEKYLDTHIPAKIQNYQKVFTRKKYLKNLYFVTMTEYSKSLLEAGTVVAYPPERVENPLGRIISEHGLRQLRMSESEKERFVTFYFNGQREDPFPGEERLIIPSPNVSTYDQKPEMSAKELTDKLLERLKSNMEYSLVVVNFANADMVSHTGNIGPTVVACELLDECVGKLANHILAFGGTLFVTADHGNAEEMINLHTGQIDTEHSVHPVPFIAVSKKYLGKSQMVSQGILADIAPTILCDLKISVPSTMSGRNLLEGLV